MIKKLLFLGCAVFVYGISTVYGADGFGGNTTGGAGGTIVTVDNAADLEYYAEISTVPYIIQISGTLNIGNSIEIRSNKTLRGLDSGATLVGQLGFRNRDSNIIIEGLNITNPGGAGEGDGISLKQDITNVFITKCTIYDCTDGCLDISNRSDLVTISWCKFYYTQNTGHNFVNLIGSSDSQTADRGKLRVTMHHNWWSTGCKERMPRVRFGQVHVYNNYYGDLLTGGYCIGVGVESHIRVENNYFDTVYAPWKDYYSDTGDLPGEIGWNDGNLFSGCQIPAWAENAYAAIFTPPYAYTLEDASRIKTIVQWGAGADGKDGYPPHWQFGYYGDFNLSGLVDSTDLVSLADYWLRTTGIDNADYDTNGIIDNQELGLFTTNWLRGKEDVTAPTAPVGLSATAEDGTVILNWNDNSEADLDGYHIYRSTVPGTGYIKLNSTLLTASDYTDNSVTNEIAYYYVVTAMDTSSNESGHSSEVSAIPVPAGTIIIQENETGFCGLDGMVDTAEHPGYTGYGYCDTTNAVGSGINWRINAMTAGIHTFTWRYTNGSTDRPARLLIDGTEAAAAFNFPATGTWENWTTVSVSIVLTTGRKEIRLEAATAGGCANMDYLKVVGPAPQAVACP